LQPCKSLPYRAVTGTSHWLHMDRPEEFNGILDEFLRNTVENSE
jgi:pimeloyl-ACP methyl ester carboxylesterase